MCGKSPDLSDRIRGAIRDQGPLPFARFMEWALYTPGLGYYCREGRPIGRKGDFFTSVSVGPVFGRILADVFREMADRLGRPAEFVIVEQGAHDGTLAADLLDAFPSDIAMEYWIIEPQDVLARLQRERLAGGPRRVRWFARVEDLPAFTGVHFSNELVDALPFHLLQSRGEGWDELFVAADHDRFVFVPGAPSVDVSRLPARPAGYRTELRPEAERWVRGVAAALERGFLLVADYGYSAADLYAPHRTDGTYACYHRHRRDARPLESPGEKDITAHVDFSALTAAALGAGLDFAGFADQHHFFVGAAGDLLRELEGPPDATRQKWLRGLQTLLHPQTMGTQFHYLAFTRGVAGPPPLAGFRHARNGMEYLLAPPDGPSVSRL